MDAFVSADGDGIGRMVGRFAMDDQVAELRQLSQRIDAGNAVFTGWAVNNGGEVIGSGGDEVRVKVPASALGELPDLRNRYAKAVGATVSVGVGMSLSESNKSLIAAKLTGKDRTVFYSKDVDKVIAENEKQETEGQKLGEQYLNKAEPPARHPPAPHDTKDHDPTAEAQKQADAGPGVEAPPAEDDHEAHFHKAAQEQEKKDKGAQSGNDDLKAQVAQVLQAVKQQAPVMEQIKQSAPDTYAAVMGMVQSIIAMAKRMGGEPMQKAEPRFTPAFRRRDDGQLVVTPDFHDATQVIDQHGGDYEDVEHDWEAGFVDAKGKFHSRQEAAGKVYSGKKAPVSNHGLESQAYNADVDAGLAKSEVPASQVIAHLREHDQTGDPEYLQEMEEEINQHPVWTLGPRIISDLDSGETRNPDIVSEYAALPRTTRPPIIVAADNTIIDGGHRTQAAQSRREKNIVAYSPKLDKAGLEPATRHNLQLPVGSKKDPSGAGTREAGKVKVRHSDVESGAPGKEAWLSMRAGMVMSQEGHPISSKNANGK